MKNKLKVLIVIILIFVVTLFFDSKVKEKEYKKEIANLKEIIEDLNNKIESENKSEFYSKCGEGYDYLAIGNSITWHRICEYWWNEIGMAATTAEKDYYHQVVKNLEDKFGNVNSKAYSFIAWETLATDRAETYALIDLYLNDKLDLVTIQLGENIQNTETIDRDYIELVNYIKQKAPNAKILLIGNFWSNSKVENAKINASKETGCEYVDLTFIQNKEEYQNKVGDIVYDAEGNEHPIDLNAVAAHPNDKAMKYIANEILKMI